MCVSGCLVCIEGRLTRFWATNAAIAGCSAAAAHIGRACIRLLTQGACFIKLPAVEPKNDASRYEGSKSSASTRTFSIRIYPAWDLDVILPSRLSHLPKQYSITISTPVSKGSRTPTQEKTHHSYKQQTPNSPSTPHLYP